MHRWFGSPRADWYPWLKKQLEQKGFVVHVPKMPTPNAPEIRTWVGALSKAVGLVDKETYFVGHSIGCLTILHYLESLAKGAKIGGVIFVAGWFRLSPEAMPSAKEQTIAQPWLASDLDLDKVAKHSEKFVAILSDNDPYVPFAENKKIFDRFAEVIVQRNKGHYDEESGVHEVPEVLKLVLDMSASV